jgi:transposase
MSDRELKRAAVLAKVADESWKLVEAAERMELSYRQAKRLWKRYLAAGAAGLAHGGTGRSNRAKDKKLRRKVIGLIRKKYSGEVGERFGPTLAAEHLSQEDGIEIAPETLRRWMLAEGLWSRENRAPTGGGESGRSTLGNWCRWTAASTIGWKGGDREAA